MGRLSRARLIAILMPTALLGGAIGSQYLGGLVPCEMCYWQRWPHLAAIILALAAIALRNSVSRNILLTILAALLVVVSGTYGVHQAGIEIWPYLAVILAVLTAIIVRNHVAMSPRLTALAALAIAVSGVIGVYHAGVEYHWWEGATRCATSVRPGSSGNLLADIMAAPVIRCDVPQWTLAGISLAGFNAILSLGAALAILLLLRRRPA